MKVVFLSFYSGLVARGVETFVDALAERLAKNHTVTVIQGGKDNQKHAYTQVVIPAEIDNWEVTVPAWQRKIGVDYYYRKILTFTFNTLSYLKAFKPDIVVPTNGGWETVLCRLYCLRNDCKLVISGQAGLGWDERWNLFCKPDLYIALTERNYHWTKTKPFWPKINIIPNGVDVAVFSKPKEVLHTLKNVTHPVILCVAGHERFKRVEETIAAVAKLKQGTLVVVGGSLATQRLGFKLLGDRYKQIKVTHSEMPSLYAGADVFTLASEPFEAFGIAYVEAMASGLPIVAPDDEQRRDIVGQAGVYINDPTDSDEYAQKLTQALEKKWGTIPLEQAKKYDWDIIAAKYEDAFNQLLAS